MSEMKNTLDEIDGSVHVAEEKISKLKDTAVQTIQTETQRKKPEKKFRASLSVGPFHRAQHECNQSPGGKESARGDVKNS